jgi:hypothetical protein
MTDAATTAMTAVTRATVAVASVLLVTGCSSISGDETHEVSEPPSYDADITAAGQVEVLTDATDPDDLRQVFDEVRDARTEGHSWTVTIRCASVAAVGSTDPVLATGRFANTQQGLAETGLAATDDVAFRTTGRADCAPVSPTTPGAITADQVIAAVEAAGLPAPNPRDSSNYCADLECLQQTTTDAFTVTVWPTPEAAVRWSEAFPLDVVRVGPVTTVGFTQGELLFPYEAGSQTRDAYGAALASLGS